MLTIPRKIPEHRYIPIPVDVRRCSSSRFSSSFKFIKKMRNAKEGHDLCCVISTKSLNGSSFKETPISKYGTFGIHIGPLQLIEYDFIAVIF